MIKVSQDGLFWFFLVNFDSKKRSGDLFLHVHCNAKSSGNHMKAYVHQDRAGIWRVGFCGGRKTGEHGEKPWKQG